MSDKPSPPNVPDNVRADVRLFTVLIIACVVVYLFNVPVSLSILVLAPIAAFFGIRALMRSKGTANLGGLRMSIVFGLGLCGISLMVGIGQAALFDLIQTQSQCRAQALTHAAQRECDVQFEHDYRERLKGWGVAVP